mgnify:CR=1 FL=1
MNTRKAKRNLKRFRRSIIHFAHSHVNAILVLLAIVILTILTSIFYKFNYTIKGTITDNKEVLADNNKYYNFNNLDCTFEVGQRVKVTISDNGTVDYFKDDKVLKVEKIKSYE